MLRFAPLSCFKPFPDPSALPTPHRGGFISSAVPSLILSTPGRADRPDLSSPGEAALSPGSWDSGEPAPLLRPLPSPAPLSSRLLRPVFLPRRLSLRSDVALTGVGGGNLRQPRVLLSQIPPVAGWLLREPGFLISRHPCK